MVPSKTWAGSVRASALTREKTPVVCGLLSGDDVEEHASDTDASNERVSVRGARISVGLWGRCTKHKVFETITAHAPTRFLTNDGYDLEILRLHASGAVVGAIVLLPQRDQIAPEVACRDVIQRRERAHGGTVP